MPGVGGDPGLATETEFEGLCIEPAARVEPSSFGFNLDDGFGFAFDIAGDGSAELSSRSVESPSSIRRGIPRTGVRSSSSLESMKRLLRGGAPPSSSLESPNRLANLELEFGVPFALAAFPRPKRKGDLGRGRFSTSKGPRSDVRITGPAELNGRLAVDPVGEGERPPNELFRFSWVDAGLSSPVPPRIDRFMVYRLLSEVRGRTFLNELEESLSLDLTRRKFGVAERFFIAGDMVLGTRYVDAVSDAARLWLVLLALGLL